MLGIAAPDLHGAEEGLAFCNAAIVRVEFVEHRVLSPQLGHHVGTGADGFEVLFGATRGCDTLAELSEMMGLVYPAKMMNGNGCGLLKFTRTVRSSSASTESTASGTAGATRQHVGAVST